MAFGDHHPYSQQDMERLVKRAGESGADGFVTTEKDAVKLTGALRLRLEQAGPVVAMRAACGAGGLQGEDDGADRHGDRDGAAWR